MDDVAIGSAIRAVRRRRRLRQADVAQRAGVARLTVGRVERGMLGRYPLDIVRRVIAVLEMRLDVGVRWHGGDLDRVANAAHAAMHESVGRFLASLAGWTWQPEVTYAIYGERGVIDILAWHAATRILLIIELKTVIADPQDLVAAMDRRRRLARRIAAEHGWRPSTFASWVIVSDTWTNRRRLASYATLLRTAFPSDGRVIRSWLRHPSGSVAALSFWPKDAPGIMRPADGRLRRPHGDPMGRSRA